MKVTLLTHTPDPDKIVAIAAKQCYSANDAFGIAEKLSTEDIGKFIQKLFTLGHYSPFEHVAFTFAIDGVSRALSHQLVRHRIASYSQRSQRYVSERDFEYVIPKSILNNQKAIDVYNDIMDKIEEAYGILRLKGVPKEDARFVLPNACTTKIVVTMNARSLFNFFNHRCCNRAQWEIREMAKLMLQEVKKVAPNIFKNSGAACISLGYCPEGEMSCGLFPTLDDYKNNSGIKEDK